MGLNRTTAKLSHPDTGPGRADTGLGHATVKLGCTDAKLGRANTRLSHATAEHDLANASHIWTFMLVDQSLVYPLYGTQHPASV